MANMDCGSICSSSFCLVGCLFFILSVSKLSINDQVKPRVFEMNACSVLVIELGCLGGKIHYKYKQTLHVCWSAVKHVLQTKQIQHVC